MIREVVNEMQVKSSRTRRQEEHLITVIPMPIAFKIKIHEQCICYSDCNLKSNVNFPACDLNSSSLASSSIQHATPHCLQVDSIV